MGIPFQTAAMGVETMKLQFQIAIPQEVHSWARGDEWEWEYSRELMAGA